MNTRLYLGLCLSLMIVCSCTRPTTTSPEAEATMRATRLGYDVIPPRSVGSTIQEAIQMLGEPDPVAKFRVGPNGTEYLFSDRSGSDYIVCAKGDRVAEVLRRKTTTRKSDNN